MSNQDTLSLCPHCNCMTKTVAAGWCGKCKENKMTPIDPDNSEQRRAKLRRLNQDSQDELERLAVNILYPSKEGGTTVSMKRVREAAALIDKAVTEARIAELEDLSFHRGAVPYENVTGRVYELRATLTNQPERSKE